MINDTGFILNIIALSINTLTCLIVFIILILIIHHLYYNRLERENKIVIAICVIIYLVILLCTIITFSFNIQTLLGDLYGERFMSSWCIFIGYFYIVLFGALLWTFVNQAFFRLCRIVYPTYRIFQKVWFYIILSPVELILVSILQSPLLFWHNIIYVSKEYYCYAEFQNLRGMLWLMMNDYGIPFSLLSLIYLRITIFIRRQPTNQAVAVKQRQQRDIIVLRRIFITVGLLVILGIPTIVFILMLYITGEQHPLFFRVGWVAVSSSMIELSFSLIILTPQLKHIVLKKFQLNRVVSLNGPVTHQNT